MKSIASEKARQRVLERQATELDARLSESDREYTVLIENFEAMKKAAVIRIDRFKEVRRAIAQNRRNKMKTIEDAEQTNAQIADNLSKLTALDAELSANLIEQSEYGQLYFLDVDGGSETPDQ